MVKRNDTRKVYRDVPFKPTVDTILDQVQSDKYLGIAITDILSMVENLFEISQKTPPEFDLNTFSVNPPCSSNTDQSSSATLESLIRTSLLRCRGLQRSLVCLRRCRNTSNVCNMLKELQ